jgi:hypothetical protein
MTPTSMGLPLVSKKEYTTSLNKFNCQVKKMSAGYVPGMVVESPEYRVEKEDARNSLEPA